MVERRFLYFVLTVVAVASFGAAVPSDRPQTKDDVRQLFEYVAAEWNKAAQEGPQACDPNREATELCLDQFKVEVAKIGLGLIRHRRLLEDLDDAKLAAFTRLMEGGWTDREEVCKEPFLDLMRRFEAETEFRYYSKDMRPLFHHRVGLTQCEELFELGES